MGESHAETTGSLVPIMFKYLFICQLFYKAMGSFTPSVTEEEMVACHTGARVNLMRQCNAYRTGTPDELAASGDYPELEDKLDKWDKGAVVEQVGNLVMGWSKGENFMQGKT